MNLADFDGKCVRVTLSDGAYYDGFCAFESAEYCEHEYGRREAALSILDALFFAGGIESVEELPDGGAFGRFRDPYGRLEKELIADGADAVADVLTDAALGDVHPEHAARILRCLADHREMLDACVIDAVRALAGATDDGSVRAEAATLIASQDRNENTEDRNER